MKEVIMISILTISAATATTSKGASETAAESGTLPSATSGAAAVAGGPAPAAKEACPVFHITHKTVNPGSTITWNNEPTRLLEQTAPTAAGLKKGSPLPPANLVNLQMKNEELQPDGRVKLISFLPSVDTPVCDSQTHQISKTNKLHAIIDRVVISMDLPYAMRRFSEAEQLHNIKFLSDYRTGRFGLSVGLQIERNGLLARSVVVVDGAGIVRYIQTVPEITDMPDLEKAYAVAFAHTTSTEQLVSTGNNR